MFPDYRVPQLLEELKILEYSKELCNKIEKGTELEHSSKEEVEIRAATIVAVDAIYEILKRDHEKVSFVFEVDWMLWQRGEKLRSQIRPNHRTLSIFY